MSKPDEALVDTLVTAGVVTKGGSAFMGPVRKPNASIPRKAVFVLVTGGASPLEFMDSTSTSQRRSTVQVRVRGDAGDFSGGQTWARSVWSAIHANKPSGFVSCLVRESEPVFLGFDETECPEWALNVEMISGG